MLWSLPKPSTLNGTSLIAELRDAGIEVPENGVRDEADGTITVEGEGSSSVVAEVVAAHDPHPQSVVPIEERVAVIEQTLDQLVNGGLAAIEGGAFFRPIE